MTCDQPLPLPDYDQLPFTTLAHQVRTLTAGDIQRLIDYEYHHADRTPVLALLQTRHQELLNGAEPSGGNPGASNDTPADTSHGSPVSPGGAAKPAGPLRHGVAGQTPERDRP